MFSFRKDQESGASFGKNPLSSNNTTPISKQKRNIKKNEETINIFQLSEQLQKGVTPVKKNLSIEINDTNEGEGDK